MFSSIVSDQEIDVVSPQMQPKVFTAGDDNVGQPYIVVMDTAIGIIGDPNTGIIVDPNYGVSLVGNVFVTQSPGGISFGGGYWRMNPQQMSCIGSSAAAPVPFMVPSTPSILQASNGITTCMNMLEGFAGF
jgi:hypothetical protein